jgi:hypothetical protein
MTFIPSALRSYSSHDLFEKYAGHYQLSSVEFLHAFMDLDGHYFYQVTGQHPVRVYPESETTFFTKNKAEQLRFDTDSPNPKLILADEPTGNLDTANGDAVMDLLTGVSKSGTTVIMVTHSLAHAGRAQRTVQLLDGHVVSETLLAA